MRSNLLALTLMSAASAAAAEAGATSDVSGTETGAQADPQTGAQADPQTDTQTGEVPSSTEPTAETKVRAPKDPSKALDILNGRMPLPIVYAIRFQEDADAKSSGLAKKYGTSVGKVFDIRKGSNFSYIDKDYKPSAEELAAARAHITTGTSTKGSDLKTLGGNPEAIEAFLAAQTVATPEEVAARGWVIKQVGVAKPKDPNAPAAAPKATKAPKAPKAAKADKGNKPAPTAGASASMF